MITAMKKEDEGNLSGILGIAFGLFMLYVVFGGLFDSGDYDSRHTITIDCSKPAMAKNSPYCNGTYQDSFNQQDAQEANFYQNTAR